MHMTHEAGVFPQIDHLHSTYVPRLYVDHLTALKDILKGQLVSITAEKTTDVRDHSVLYVITTIRDQPYLISVVKMDVAITGHLVKPSSSLSLM